MTREIAVLFFGVTLAVTPVAAVAQAAAEPAPAPAPKPAGFDVKPYGFILANAFWSSGTFAAYDYPGNAGTTGQGSFLMSARQSRFGFRLSAPEDGWTGARLTGVIEVDFNGGFPTNTAGATTTASNQWYNAVMRLRIAAVTATWDLDFGKFYILAGQDYRLAAPIGATSLAYVATPLFQQAGNLSQRTPQFRVGVDAGLINAAVAMGSPQDAGLGAAPITAGPAATTVDNGAGNRSRWPSFDGRLGIAYYAGKNKIGELGIGGAWEKRRYYGTGATPTTFNNLHDVDAILGALDLEVNLPYVTLKGEAFSGKAIDDVYAPAMLTSTATLVNLQNFNGNITQGLWGQLTLKPIPEVNVLAGWGVEQAKIDDLIATGAAAGTRTHNIIASAGVIVNASKAWRFGFEATQTMSETLANFNPGAAHNQQGKAQQYALSSQLTF